MEPSKKTYYNNTNYNKSNSTNYKNNKSGNTNYNRFNKSNDNKNSVEDDNVKEIYSSLETPKTIIKSNDVLPTPSDEQNEIMMNFKTGYNLKIEAVAGAGKTTTLLYLAKIAMNTFNVKSLILTYNKSLQVEIQKTIDSLDLTGSCFVYTYHGYASKLYKKVINNDKILRQSLQGEPIINPQMYVLLLDEVQDMNEDYHKFVSKITFQGQMLVLVGDRRQTINGYIGASDKYLINYEEYFNSGRSWKELTLRTSYRMTPAIANFVNKNIINEDLIIGGNISSNNIKPLYYYSEWNFSKDNILASMVKVFGADEIVIMKPSVANVSLKQLNNNTSTKALCPLGKLINNTKDIKFCVREEDALTEKEMKGKVLISSFNSMKGKEKSCVIIYNTDESYFKFFDKTWNEPKKLPNIVYVANTRASACLILIQGDKEEHFRTTNKDIITSTCNVIGYKDDKKNDKEAKKKKDNFTITDVIKHRTTTDIIKMLDLIKITEINKESDPLSYDHLIGFGAYYEDMRTYYGMLIPVIAEFMMKGDIRFNEEMPLPDENNGMTEPIYIVKRYNELITNKSKTLKEWMELLVINNAMMSGYFFYIEQITNYDWVDYNFVNESVNRLMQILSNNNGNNLGDLGDFEVYTSIKKVNLDKTKYNKHNLNGSIDYLTKDDIWEFKNVTSLNDEHKLQCAAYIALHYLQKDTMLSGKLFNTRTKELLEIKLDNPELFIEYLMNGK